MERDNHEEKKRYSKEYDSSPGSKRTGTVNDQRQVTANQRGFQHAANSYMSNLTAGSSWLHGKEVPKGVTFLRSLGDGWAVGYDAKAKKVYLYKDHEHIAHIEIDIQGSMTVPGKKDIILHTHTDKTAAGEGGQGYMSALAPIALKFIADNYTTGEYANINMAPAHGAATKGLIDQLTRYRSQLEPSAPYMEEANIFLETAAVRRAERKKQGKTKELGANAWDDDLMHESAFQLEALRRMEAAHSTGILVTGVNAGINIVGQAHARLESGNAFDWFESSRKVQQSLLQVIIPIRSLKGIIKANFK